MAIPQELVDRMMVDCGRRCCLCRRFKPIHLQVHHIDERATGGSDEWDNLIALCLTCHTDVHSKVPFTRRFTHAELKGHRDSLLARVTAGDFDPNESDDFSPSILASRTTSAVRLSKEAVELLLTAANLSGPIQGTIHVIKTDGGTIIAPGNFQKLYPVEDKRKEALYRAALGELEQAGYVERSSAQMREVTNSGYLMADELASQLGQVKPI